MAIRLLWRAEYAALSEMKPDDRSITRSEAERRETRSVMIKVRMFVTSKKVQEILNLDL